MSPASRARAGMVSTVPGSSPRYFSKAAPTLPLEQKPTSPLGSIPRRHRVCCGYRSPLLGDSCGNLPGEKILLSNRLKKGHGNLGMATRSLPGNCRFLGVKQPFGAFPNQLVSGSTYDGRRTVQ